MSNEQSSAKNSMIVSRSWTLNALAISFNVSLETAWCWAIASLRWALTPAVSSRGERMRASGLLDCRVTPLSWRVPHNRPARSTAKLLRRARRGLQQIPHFLLPESRVESSCVTGGLVAGGYQQYTAILHPLDLAVQDSKFRWITLSC